MTAASMTPQEQKKRDKRLGVGYSITSVLLVSALVFFGVQFRWDSAIGKTIASLPSIAQSVLSGRGIPLSDEDSKRVLQEGYAILAEYDAQVAVYASRFNAEYLADDDTRMLLYDDLEVLVEELTSDECGLYWLKSGARPVSEDYQATQEKLDACRNYLSQYFSMLSQAMGVSLQYTDPFSQEEIDEIWSPIAVANDEEGQNVYMVEFERVYEEANPDAVATE